jgi:carbon-monoxide dehydrogenase medium subunit
MLRLTRCDYLAPETLEEALSIIVKEGGEAKIIAGGTDLLVKMKRREVHHKQLVGLRRIPNLDNIIEEGGHIRLGPLVTHEEASQSLMLRKHVTLLAEACGDLGSYQIRCMGTVTGNICNASPSADSIPSLLALDARIRILNPEGERSVPLDQIFVGPFETALRYNDMVTAVEIPKPPPGSRGVYLKMPKVTEKDETLVGVALLLRRETSTGKIEHIRLGLGSVAPIPMRAKETEIFLTGKNPEDPKTLAKAKDLLMGEISPRSRADYRRHITEYLFEEGLRVLLSKSS